MWGSVTETRGVSDGGVRPEMVGAGEATSSVSPAADSFPSRGSHQGDGVWKLKKMKCGARGGRPPHQSALRLTASPQWEAMGKAQYGRITGKRKQRGERHIGLPDSTIQRRPSGSGAGPGRRSGRRGSRRRGRRPGRGRGTGGRYTAFWRGRPGGGRRGRQSLR